jgi:hypothetical protein
MIDVSVVRTVLKSNQIFEDLVRLASINQDPLLKNIQRELTPQNNISFRTKSKSKGFRL